MKNAETSAVLTDILASEGFKLDTNVSAINPFNLFALLKIMAHPEVYRILSA